MSIAESTHRCPAEHRTVSSIDRNKPTIGFGDFKLFDDIFNATNALRRMLRRQHRRIRCRSTRSILRREVPLRGLIGMLMPGCRHVAARIAMSD